MGAEFDSSQFVWHNVTDEQVEKPKNVLNDVTVKSIFQPCQHNDNFDGFCLLLFGLCFSRCLFLFRLSFHFVARFFP